jgi:hypothetical protein
VPPADEVAELLREREVYTFLWDVIPTPGWKIPAYKIYAISCTSGTPADSTEYNCTYIYRCRGGEKTFRCSNTEIFLKDKYGRWSLKKCELY